MSEPGARATMSGRTWPERLAIAATVTAAVLAFACAAGLAIGYAFVTDRPAVQISSGAGRPATGFEAAGAAAFGNRDGMGERSDTIMMFRVDPTSSRVAVLSFPRDLYVRIAGAGNRARINSAYRRDDPQRLIDTIAENFGVFTDHFIQVDFCTFKTLVDAVGGVTVPFEFPARDPNSGLNAPGPGCFTFDGDHALAYVRSRHYEYEDPPGSGNWKEDPSSDLGRISRQQDFLRRSLTSILNKGLLNPSVAGGLIESATGGDVVTSSELSLAKLMEFAGVLRDVEAASIPSYQIEAVPRTIGGAAVLEPRIEGDNMQAVLAMFRGETSLADAP